MDAKNQKTSAVDLSIEVQSDEAPPDMLAQLQALGLGALVKSHSISGDGESITMRPIGEFAEAIRLTQKLSCQDRSRAMQNIAKFSVQSHRYRRGGGGYGRCG